MRADRGRWEAGRWEERRTAGARAGGWLLLAAWLFILLPALCLAAWIAAPPAWRSTLGLPQPGGQPAAVVVLLPALPGYQPGQSPAAAPQPAAGAPPAWQVWRAPPAAAAPDRPLIAVVLTGLGRSGQVTAQAVALPGPLGLAFSPYGRPFGEVLAAARAAGHELLLELPMKGEAGDPLDLGPQALLPLLDAEQNLRRLAWLLDGPTPGPAPEPLVGALVVDGGGFLLAEDVALPVLAELARRGLLLVLSGPAEPAQRLATAAALPLLLADQAASGGAGVEAALAAAERVALLRGAALVVLSADAATVARLVAWTASLEARGFALAPPTQLLQRRATQ